MILALGILPGLWAQQHDEADQDTTWKKLYRESPPRINDLVHTKLDVKFDYSKSQMMRLLPSWLPL